MPVRALQAMADSGEFKFVDFVKVGRPLPYHPLSSPSTPWSPRNGCFCGFGCIHTEFLSTYNIGIIGLFSLPLSYTNEDLCHPIDPPASLTCERVKLCELSYIYIIRKYENRGIRRF